MRWASWIPLCVALWGCVSRERPEAPATMPADRGLVQATQLTFPDRFVKAGEAYFDPAGGRIVFQAIEWKAPGEPESEHYALYVADLQASGDRWALANIRRVSPPGSANTCGWFHPVDPNRLLFCSTIGAPGNAPAPGYQRDGRTYRWSFPPEMRIVELDLRKDGRDPGNLKVLAGDGKAYTAESSLSRDGRTLLFTSLRDGNGELYVKDLPTGQETRLTSAPGYDGGPFFSPDDARVIWRGDRVENNLLQLYAARVVRDAQGRVTGLADERPLTADEHVNWAPFFTPDGRAAVYASSRVSHRNYEVFVLPTSGTVLPEPIRVTTAEGADLLPVVSPDGRWLLWTSQRGEGRTSQLWIAEVTDDSPIRAASAASGSDPASKP
jgi:TolB protein